MHMQPSAGTWWRVSSRCCYLWMVQAQLSEMEGASIVWHSTSMSWRSIDCVTLHVDVVREHRLCDSLHADVTTLPGILGSHNQMTFAQSGTHSSHGASTWQHMLWRNVTPTWCVVYLASATATWWQRLKAVGQKSWRDTTLTELSPVNVAMVTTSSPCPPSVHKHHPLDVASLHVLYSSHCGRLQEM